LIAVQASADAAVPSPDVTTRVIIRESASSQSAQIGNLGLTQAQLATRIGAAGKAVIYQ
jgi:hypothetical protein